MNTEQERAAFEAFASKHGLCVTEDNDLYRSHLVTWMWRAWQARAALQSQDREDAERLDWLEEQAQASRTGVSIDYVYDAEDGYVNEKGYRFMRYRFIGPLGRSAREAIDHARRIEGDSHE